MALPLPVKVAVDTTHMLMAALVPSSATARVFRMSQDRVRFLSTAFNVEEARRKIPIVGERRGLSLQGIRRSFERLEDLNITAYALDAYRMYLLTAKDDIRDEQDADLLALARAFQVPVLTQDRDFTNLGIVVYSTGELLALLEVQAS